MAFAKFDSKKINNTERKAYYEGLGIKVDKNLSYLNALKVSNMDFEVIEEPIYNANGSQIDNWKQIVRQDTGDVFTITKDRYSVCQNTSLANIMQPLIDKGYYIDTMGTYGNGARSFFTLSSGTTKILDDEFNQNILGLNTYDGSGSIMFMFTPIRVFCSNCLVRALNNATNRISVKHSGELDPKLTLVSDIITSNVDYMDKLRKQCETDATTGYTKDQFIKWSDNFLITEALASGKKNTIEELSKSSQENLEAKIQLIRQAYNQPDLNNFNNSLYKGIQAVSDYESHKPVFRSTEKANETNIITVVSAMPMLKAFLATANV